jgi:hypothetical protein
MDLGPKDTGQLCSQPPFFHSLQQLLPRGHSQGAVHQIELVPFADPLQISDGACLKAHGPGGFLKPDERGSFF